MIERTAEQIEEQRNRDLTPERREARRNSNRNRIREDNELHPLSRVRDTGRRESCRNNFRLYCETYLKGIFSDEWSDAHLEAIRRIEGVILKGDLYAFAMPRGFGKTSLCLAACLWSILYGHCKWICMVAATGPASLTLLEDIKTILMASEPLAEDFPEATWPMHMSEDQGIKAKNLRWKGELAGMRTSTKRLAFPDIPGSESACAVITVVGIRGNIRGQRKVVTDEDGSVMIQRPDRFLVDDPQTYESATSDADVNKRLGILGADIKKLARQGQSMGGFVPCTVIRPGCMADQLLDTDKYPEYHGTRTKLLNKFPDRMDLWEQYDDIRRIDLAGGGDGKEVPQEFYQQNQEKMDAGAEVSWPHLTVQYGLTVLHYCMHRYLEDPASFFAEDQNDPQPIVGDEEDMLTKEAIAESTNAYGQGIVPQGVECITGHVDVQLHCLFYCVIAWKPDATGYILEYDTFPKQRSRHFEYKKLVSTLAKEYPSLSKEARIRKAVSVLTTSLCGRRWKGDDGADYTIKRLLVDGNWMADEVYQECRESPYAGALMPARGKYVGASSKELNEDKARRGGPVKLGLHWRVEKSNRYPIKFCTFDTNYWKSWIHNRFGTDPKDRGALTLYDAPARDHKSFSAHQVGEYAIRTEGRGRVVYEWSLRPDRPDNHWFDNVVGAAVAASMEGIVLPATGTPNAPRGKRKSLSQMQKEKRGKR
jgi:hypothetical protein